MTAPTLKGQNLDRAPVADNTLDDPLFVAVRPGSEYVAAWASIAQPHFHTRQGYTPVRPNEVELLPGLVYTPASKDFGVYFEFDKKADTIRQGEHILMKMPRERHAQQRKLESDRMRGLKPTKTDPGEQAALKSEEAVSLASELKGT